MPSPQTNVNRDLVSGRFGGSLPSHRLGRPNDRLVLERSKGRCAVPSAGPDLRASGRRSAGRAVLDGPEIPERCGFGRRSERWLEG